MCKCAALRKKNKDNKPEGSKLEVTNLDWEALVAAKETYEKALKGH